MTEREGEIHIKLLYCTVYRTKSSSAGMVCLQLKGRRNSVAKAKSGKSSLAQR